MLKTQETEGTNPSMSIANAGEGLDKRDPLPLRKALSLLGYEGQNNELVKGLREFGEFGFTTRVTPEAAQAIKSADMKFQRPSQRVRVKHLASAMKEQQFGKGSAMMFAVVADVKTGHVKDIMDTPVHMLDGGSRIRAIVRSEIATPLTVVVAAYDTEGQMERDAFKVDAHASRNPADMAQILRIMEKHKLPSRSAATNFLPAVQKIISNGLDEDGPSGRDAASALDIQYDSIKRYAGPAKAYANIVTYGSSAPRGDAEEIGGDFRDHLFEIPVYACGIASVKANEKLADGFWAAITKQTAERGTPEHALMEYIRKGKHHKLAESRSGIGESDQRRLIMACCIAWDHKRDKKKLSPTALDNAVVRWFESHKRKPLQFAF